MSAWIDFKELRQKLDFEEVLRHYGIEVKRKGNQHHGYCPLPNHNGKRNSPSFSANLERGIFQCFGCGAKGNVLEFAAMMEKVDSKDGAAFRKVAGELQRRFCPELGASTETKKTSAKKPEKTEPKNDLPVVVNAPLDFELKGLDAEHPYLKGRGFTPETIKHFGLGFCSRGLGRAQPVSRVSGKTDRSRGCRTTGKQQRNRCEQRTISNQNPSPCGEGCGDTLDDRIFFKEDSNFVR